MPLKGLQEKPNVLLVDDSDMGLLALQTVLQDCGYNLVLASSGAEALTKLLQMDVAVILLDVQMPEMNGFETASYIKKREKTRGIPIIFVTGQGTDEKFVTYGYETGAVDYIFKPFDPQILRKKVSVFVDLYETTRQIKLRSEHESRMRYRNLADAIPHIVWRAGADLSVEYFNRTWTSYTGLSLEKSLGAGWMSAFSSDDLPIFLEAWSKGNQTREGFQLEARIYHAQENAHRWHLVRAVVEEIGNDGIVSWLITCTDIHTQKEFEAQLVKAKNDADNANRAKSAFLANMSHEIRTPLGAIMGFSDLLLEDTTDGERIHHVDVIKRNGEQLLKIIDEILDISKIESGSLRVAREKVDLRELIRAVQSAVVIQASKKGISLSFEVDGQVPERLFTDPTRLKQVLINIVGNAVKFSSTGAVQIRISYQSEKGLIFFAVKDSGPGIDEKHIGSLFRPFSQGDSSTSRKFGGTGLGLVISRKLARALGGNVELTATQLGTGTTFTASVNAGIDDTVPFISKLDGPSSVAATAQTSGLPAELQGVKVLVADDAEENQMLISMFLQKAGASVELASDGEEAIERALSGNHNVVLMDIQMPKVDGYQATQTLRERGFVKPILAVTAHAMVEERERCMNFGCSDYISKPLDPKALIKLVARHCHIN